MFGIGPKRIEPSTAINSPGFDCGFDSVHGLLNHIHLSKRQRADLAFVNIDAESRAGQLIAAAAVVEGEVLFGESVVDEEAVEAAFEISQIRNAAGKMSAGG